EPSSVECYAELGLSPGVSFRARVLDHPPARAETCIPARAEILDPVGDWTWTNPMPGIPNGILSGEYRTERARTRLPRPSPRRNTQRVPCALGRRQAHHARPARSARRRFGARPTRGPRGGRAP